MQIRFIALSLSPQKCFNNFQPIVNRIDDVLYSARCNISPS